MMMKNFLKSTNISMSGMRMSFMACTALCLMLPSVAFAIEPAKENVPGGALMLGAYILIWALPLAFLWFSNKRLTGLETEVREVRDLLQRVNVPTQAGEPVPDSTKEDATE